MHTVDATTEAPTLNATRDAGSSAVARRATTRDGLARRLWLALWPKIAAVTIGLMIWQIVVWSGWRPEYVLPAPATVFQRLGELIADGTVATALATTAERAAYGFTTALAIGVAVGGLVSSSRIVRRSHGSRSPSCCSD
jgi:NitT/TauT family transport system permease protein